MTKVDRAAGEINHRLPQFLPGMKAVLFTVVRNPFDVRASQIAVHTIATGRRTILVDGSADARFVPTGHLLYARMGKLLAVPFDVDRLAVTGAEIGVLDDVMQAANFGGGSADTGAMQVAVSAAGTLAHVPGGWHPTGIFRSSGSTADVRFARYPCQSRSTPCRGSRQTGSG